MAAKDPTARRLSAVIAANAYRANPERRSARRRQDPVPPELVEGYAAEVDPRGELTDKVRAQRIAAAWRRDEARRLLDAHRATTTGDDGGAAA